MSRIFGALANAASKYGEGRFKRQAYDNSQAQQSLENERRAFEFAANQGRLTEQMNLLKQQRDDQLQRQREADVVSAQQHGYESAPVESVGSGVNAYLQSQGMGGPATAQALRAQSQPVYQQAAEGVNFDAGKQPDVQYATVGGRLMRYDPQRGANEATRKAFEGFMKDIKIKRDVAQEGQDQKARDRLDQIRLAAQLRPAPQQQTKRDLFIDKQGGYHYVQQGDDIPPDWKPAAGAAGNKPPTAGERQANALLEFGKQGAEGAAARYRSGFSPNMMDQIAEQLPPAVGNILMSGAAQELYADNEKLVMASQYLLSGKAVTKVEAKKIARGLVIQPGDTEETKRYKMGQIQLRLDILAKAAGQPSPKIDVNPGLTPEQQARFDKFRKP